MDKYDYLVEYWITGEFDDRCYHYCPYTTYNDACLIGELESQLLSLQKYREEIFEKAKQNISILINDRYYLDNLIKEADNILLHDYTQYAVYRVLPETPKSAIKNWVDDPDYFIHQWTEREC